MTYKIDKFEISEGIFQEAITVFLTENSAITFLADDNSPDYIAWLETEDGKTYLAEKETN